MRLPASALAAAALAACAAAPLEPDRTARAPELPGFGALAWPVTTASPAAQRAFTQGVLQAYAFNEIEAVRQFKAALAQDPRCAMCAWGVAWQLGPNINDRGRSRAPEALRYADLALRLAGSATPRERALIDAMALRYGHASQARDSAPALAERCGGPAADDAPDPLDVAYAARLRPLAAAAPHDAELLALWAEAELIATPGDWWDEASGRPAGQVGAVVDALEHALRDAPGHTGLNHYLIHATDAQVAAARAEAAADRLGTLAPAAPHLLHMPAHTYGRLGRYADALRVNEAAVAADEAQIAQQQAQGFAPSVDWRNHNQHFLWYAALMDGRGDVALAAARAVAGRAQARDEYRRTLPMLTLLRLERWQALIDEPLPAPGPRGVAQVLGQHARGIAAVRLGRLPDARAALAQAQDGAALVARSYPKDAEWDRAVRGLAAAARERLEAELALAEGRIDAALALQADALRQQKAVDENEPPMLAAGGALALGDLQRRAGRLAEAEQTLRAELALRPRSGWALDALARVLRAQGRAPEADALNARLDDAWGRADATLRARL